jgi:hypothetical protein
MFSLPYSAVAAMLVFVIMIMIVLVVVLVVVVMVMVMMLMSFAFFVFVVVLIFLHAKHIVHILYALKNVVFTLVHTDTSINNMVSPGWGYVVVIILHTSYITVNI